MVRISSFFMEWDRTRCGDGAPLGAQLGGVCVCPVVAPVRDDSTEIPGDYTLRRSRAPVSEDGCRSFDMARASI
jgi:hypothetical protein